MEVKEKEKFDGVGYYYDVGRDDFFKMEYHYMVHPEEYIEEYVDSEMNAGQKNQYLLGIINSAIVYGSLEVAFLYNLNIDRSENPEMVKKLIETTKKEYVEVDESLEDQLDAIKFIINRKYSAKEISTAIVEFKELYLYSKGD